MIKQLSSVCLATALAMLLGLCLLPTPGWAQVTPPMPPYHTFIDNNGVDLTSDQLNLTWTDISIGDVDSNGLSLVRNNFASPQGLSTNIYQTIAYATFPGGGGPPISAAVNFMGQSHSFTGYMGVFTSDQGDGSTLNYISGPPGFLIFQTAQGVTATYQLFGCSCGNFNIAPLTKITYPNGKTTSIHNKLVLVNVSGTNFMLNRIQSITTNFGYQLKFQYVSDVAPTSLTGPWNTVARVTAVNNAYAYCDPDADSCSLAGWPYVSYNQSTIGSTTTFQVVKMEGATETYTCEQLTSAGCSITAVQQPLSSTPDVMYGYNIAGALSSITKGGSTWYYDYDYPTITVKDPNLGVRTVFIDAISGQPGVDQSPLGFRTFFNYDSLGRLIKVIQPEGNYTIYLLDDRGNTTKTTIHSKSTFSVPDIVLNSGFSASPCTNQVTCNQPMWTQDALGNQTDYSYDSLTGALTVKALPAPVSGGVRPVTYYGYQSLYAYYLNASGSIVASSAPVSLLVGTSQCQTMSSCSGAADEVATGIGYGSVGVANNLLPTATTQAAGDGSVSSSLQFAYDTVGNRILVCGPLGFTTCDPATGSGDLVRYRFDGDRRSTGVTTPVPGGPTSPPPRAVRYHYDPNGNMDRADIGTVPNQSDSAWNTAFSTYYSSYARYDNLGRTVAAGLEDGSGAQTLTQTSYDALGRTWCTAVRMNPVTFASSPPACTLGTSGAYGPDRIAQIAYDPDSRPTSVINALDVTGVQRTTVTTTYTSNSQVQTVADAKTNTTTYEYDGFDRLLKICYPGSACAISTDYEQTTYDAASNVVSLRMRDGNSIIYGYDNLNRRATKSGAATATTYTYDNLSRLTNVFYTGNPSDRVQSNYDALSRLINQTTLAGTTAYGYDAAGNRTAMAWPDGFYVNYDYDLTGNVLAVRENGAVSGAGLLASYSYDGIGRKVSDQRGNGTLGSYGYDTISRLAHLQEDLPSAPSYNYQALSYNPASQLGQMTNSNPLFAYLPPASGTVNSSANGLNQIASSGGSTASYDARGNLLALGGYGYGYDQENHLTAVAVPTPAALGYDPLGRLELKTVSGTTERLLLDDAGGVVAEVGGGGAISQRWVPGPGTDERVAWYNGSGVTDRRYLSTDVRGSIAAVTNSSAAVLGVNTYDPYGVGGGSNLGAIAYTGQYKLIGQALYYYKGRIYDPQLGRFLQTDPIGYDGGMNLYAYVGGDPINRADPTGLACVDQGDGSCLIDPVDDPVQSECSRRPDCQVISGGSGAQYFQPVGGSLGGAARDPSGGGNSLRPQRNFKLPPCGNGTAAKIADWADKISVGTGAVAVASGALGLIAAPSGAGFVGLEALAAFSGAASTFASGVGTVAHFANGDYVGAALDAGGIIGGFAAGKLAGGAVASTRTFNNLTASQARQVKLLSNATGTTTGAASNLYSCSR